MAWRSASVISRLSIIISVRTLTSTRLRPSRSISVDVRVLEEQPPVDLVIFLVEGAAGDENTDRHVCHRHCPLSPSARRSHRRTRSRTGPTSAQLKADGTLLAAGPQDPRFGGLFLLRVPDDNAAGRARRDPRRRPVLSGRGRAVRAAAVERRHRQGRPATKHLRNRRRDGTTADGTIGRRRSWILPEGASCPGHRCQRRSRVCRCRSSSPSSPRHHHHGDDARRARAAADGPSVHAAIASACGSARAPAITDTTMPTTNTAAAPIRLCQRNADRW